MPVSAAPTYQFTVEEYLKLGEAGIFHEGGRVELLNGDIVVMRPIGVRHMNSVSRLNNRASKLYGGRCLVDAQNSLVVDGQSMPQPDLLLLRLELDESAAPGPADVLLLVEVSESSAGLRPAGQARRLRAQRGRSTCISRSTGAGAGYSPALSFLAAG
jgi:Uma2 family endonuclease